MSQSLRTAALIPSIYYFLKKEAPIGKWLTNRNQTLRVTDGSDAAINSAKMKHSDLHLLYIMLSFLHFLNWISKKTYRLYFWHRYYRREFLIYKFKLNAWPRLYNVVANIINKNIHKLVFSLDLWCFMAYLIVGWLALKNGVKNLWKSWFFGPLLEDRNFRLKYRN